MKTILIGVLIALFYNCTERVYIVKEAPSTSVNFAEYFGDVNSITYPEVMKANTNENCKMLLTRITNLRAYIGGNKERLSIKDWHETDEIKPLFKADTIHSENSLYSYDGEDIRQISKNNDYDYFWKTDAWFVFFGIADIVEQKSDLSKGHHIYYPPSVDSFKDDITWYKTTDSLVINVIRTGGWGRDNVSIWINTKTNSGKLEFLCGECTNYHVKDSYNWTGEGKGTYNQYDLISKTQTQIDSWE